LLKYTFGGLLAFAILAATGFVILAQVDDGDADVQPARQIDIVIPPGGARHGAVGGRARADHRTPAAESTGDGDGAVDPE
jgi:hypothetical protein